jgi:hypothetical protein
VTGTVQDGSYKLAGDEIVFERTLHGLRNTVLLPAGWEVAAYRRSSTLGRTAQGRAFVALINLNAENNYKVRFAANWAPSRDHDTLPQRTEAQGTEAQRNSIGRPAAFLKIPLSLCGRTSGALANGTANSELFEFSFSA